MGTYLRPGILAVLAVGIAMLLAAGSAMAERGSDRGDRGRGGERGRPATVVWSPAELSPTVAVGTTVSTTVSFSVTAAVASPHFDVKPRLERGERGRGKGGVALDTTGLPASLVANQTYSVIVGVTAPTDPRERLSGEVQLRNGRRELGRPLRVRATVPGTPRATRTPSGQTPTVVATATSTGTAVAISAATATAPATASDTPTATATPTP